jgi:isoleucyl-tRNA synthetase
MTIVAPEKIRAVLRNVEEFLLELANVKTVEYMQKTPEYTSQEGWTSVSEGEMQVFINVQRDEGLLGEGLMRDLARRVQALRKELGYMPTDILNTVHIAELDDESITLLKPYSGKMRELVRTKQVSLHCSREEVKTDWHECQLDDKRVFVAISK